MAERGLCVPNSTVVSEEKEKPPNLAIRWLFLWRRRRDLNPRDTFAPYSLSRGAPSPLGYFSKGCCLYKKMWRRGWDSNPRALSDKRFSRPPRYDHFDTSAFRACVYYHKTSVMSRTFFKKLNKLYKNRAGTYRLCFLIIKSYLFWNYSSCILAKHSLQ